MLLAVATTPLTEHTRWLDKIEASEKPHAYPETDDGEDHPAPAHRRVRITFKDLQRHGFTDMCPRCSCHASGNHRRATFHHHSEFCRSRLYDCLKAEGASKIRLAPAERTATKTSISTHKKSILKKMRDASASQSASPTDAEGANDDADILKLDSEGFGGDIPKDDAALFAPSEDEDDTSNFYRVVNDDHEMVENAASVANDDYMNCALMDTLQCLGVDCLVACNFAASVCRDKSRFAKLHRELDQKARLVGSLTRKRPTFVEMYGQGKIVEMANLHRRNLNLDGLCALDVRTCKQDGSPWDVNNPRDR